MKLDYKSSFMYQKDIDAEWTLDWERPETLSFSLISKKKLKVTQIEAHKIQKKVRKHVNETSLHYKSNFQRTQYLPNDEEDINPEFRVKIKIYDPDVDYKINEGTQGLLWIINKLGLSLTEVLDEIKLAEIIGENINGFYGNFLKPVGIQKQKTLLYDTTEGLACRVHTTNWPYIELQYGQGKRAFYNKINIIEFRKALLEQTMKPIWGLGVARKDPHQWINMLCIDLCINIEAYLEVELYNREGPCDDQRIQVFTRSGI